MTPETTHSTTDLLAYLDGELSERDQARVTAHLATCAACAAELAQLRALRGDLRATLDVALAPVQLSRVADARIREALRHRNERPAWLLTFWRQRGLTVQALMAVLVLAFSLNLFPTLQAGPAQPSTATETVVLNQERLIPGSEAAVRVIVRSAENALPLLGAQITVLLAPRGGAARPVYTGATGAGGTADIAFTVPADLTGAANLIIETRTPAGQERIVRPITIARSYRLYLSSDKPAYRPGQSLYVRALALDALDYLPPTGAQVTFTLLGPARQQLWQTQAAVSEFGAADAVTDLPLTAPTGTYTLRVTLGDTISERTLTVGQYRLPAYQLTLTPDRAFYQPGDRVTGVLEAAYFFGKPVAAAQVVLHGVAAGNQALDLRGVTDAQGRFAFAFNLPLTFGDPEPRTPQPFTLEARVTDVVGQVEGVRHTLPVAAQGVLLRALPEGGVLRPGVENTLFILAAHPDGSPAPATLLVTLDRTAYTLRTDAYGLAMLTFTPAQATTPIAITAQADSGATGQTQLTLTGDTAQQQLLLRAERALYRAGETLRVEALTAGLDALPDPTLYLDIARAGQTVALLSAPLQGGRAVFALDLEPGWVGALELRAYALLPDGRRVTDTRLIVVDPPSGVDVAITADAPQYRPGATAALTVQTTLAATGVPVQAALGLVAVDESVYALDTLPPGFARAYLLLEKDLFTRAGSVPGFDAAALRASEDLAARAAWAELPGAAVLTTSRITSPAPPAPPLSPAQVLALTLTLALLAMLLTIGIIRGLQPAGVLPHALRRVSVGFVILTLAGWLVFGLLAGVLWLLQAWLGGLTLLSLLGTLLALPWLWLVIAGWRRGDARLQITTGLLAAYLVLLIGLVWATGQNVPISALLIALVTLSYLAIIATVALLGQGLILEGQRGLGWLTTAFALLLIVAALGLPLISGLASDLSRTLGHPALYAGPVGWITGCGAPATYAPVATEAPATQTPQATTEAPVIVPTTEATPPPAPTATPLAPPAEPWPLRQLFPETLYWQPQALTDEHGQLALTLPLADNITTWRFTALASTRSGDLGAATYDIVVFQDFFIELALPDVIRAGAPLTVTATLYNFLPEAQNVQLTPTPADWYTLLAAPEALRIEAQGVTTATLRIRPEQGGTYTLQIHAAGARMSDGIAVPVTVEP